MGKRTLRTLHYELVAGVIRKQVEIIPELPDDNPEYKHGAAVTVDLIARNFADEFEIRAGVNFDRSKFLRACGLEGE